MVHDRLFVIVVDAIGNRRVQVSTGVSGQPTAWVSKVCLKKGLTRVSNNASKFLNYSIGQRGAY